MDSVREKPMTSLAIAAGVGFLFAFLPAARAARPGMLTTLIAGLASGETMLAVRRARRAAIVYTLALLAVLCGLGFLIGAGYIFAADRYGSLRGSTRLRPGLSRPGRLIILIHKMTAKVRARRAVERRSADLKAVGIAAAVAALPTLLRGKAGLGSLLVADACACRLRDLPRKHRARPDDLVDR